MANSCWLYKISFVTGLAAEKGGGRIATQAAPTPVNVSVIIAAYNAASTIAEAIESVLAQTCPNWEAIVVDDGSSDATSEIAHRFAEQDRRISVVRQSNGGESAARNTGIEHARYDWLLFLDADDWISPAHLEHLTSELAAHPELDAVHCGWVRVALDGTQVADDYLAPTGDLFPILARRAAFPVNACIVRKSLVEAVGKLDTSLRKCPDWDLWQRIARTGVRFGAVREVLAYYRMTPSSSSLDAEQLFRDGLTVLRRGYAADPRVSNPHPDYVNGLVQDKVESQVFYLLCWNAGLLLGSGRDPRVLLEAVRDYHYTSLGPGAIAKCIFEAGTLPASQPRDAWEGLFPRIVREIEEFLMALETQSQTPNLGAAALLELKKTILRQSPAWRAVVEELEGERLRLTEQWRSEKAALERELRVARQQQAALERELGDARQQQAALETDLDRSRKQQDVLAQEMAVLEESLEETRVQADGLELEKSTAEEELRRGRQLTAERERLLAQLRGRAWIRLGTGFGVLKETDLRIETGSDPRPAREIQDTHVPEALTFKDEPNADSEWQLRVAPGNAAELHLATGHPGTVRVDISRASSQAKWNIQLNHGGLKVTAGSRYALHFRARSDRARSIGAGIAKAYEPWTNLGYYREIRLTPEWRSFQEEVTEVTLMAGEDNARVHFDLGGRKVAVEVSAVTFRCLDDPPVPSRLEAGAEGGVETKTPGEKARA